MGSTISGIHKEKLFRVFLFTILAVGFSAVVTAAPSVTASHPDDGESVESNFNFTITYTADTGADPAWCGARDTDTDQWIAVNDSVQSGVETNISASLSPGTLVNYRIGCNSTADGPFDPQNGDPVSQENCFEVGDASEECGGGGGGPEGPGGEQGLEIDDQLRITRDTENPNIAYLGSSLNIQGANISRTYNLTRDVSTSETLVDGHNATNPISTSLSDTEGRYTLYDETNSSNNVSIDLVKNESDVIGRIKNDSVTNNVAVHYWDNGSQIPSSNFSVTVDSSWGGPKEALYRLNITPNRDQFWINVSDSRGSAFAPVRAAKGYIPDLQFPRVDDITLTGRANLTVYVTNNNTNSAESDLKLRLRRYPTGQSAFFPSRTPKQTVPPTEYGVTNSSGGHTFTGLQAGSRYIADVVNHTHVKSSNTALLIANKPGTMLKADQEKSTVFNVTTDVGNASLKMIGKQGVANTKYGFIITEFGQTGNSYMKTDVKPGTPLNISVPNSSYSITAAKFLFTGAFFPSIQTDFASVTVPLDGTSETKKLGFPTLVTLNGTVTESGGSNTAVKDAMVFAENQSDNLFYVGRTNDQGEYTIKVRNQTGYNITVEPGFRSSLGSASKQVDVSGKTTSDFSLSTGPYIEGYVNLSATEGIEGVEVNAWNGTKDSFGSAETNSNGYYKIGGLKNNTNHSLFVEPRKGYSGKQRSGATALESGSWENFTLGSQQYDLNGSIKSSSGALNATVRLEPLGPEVTLSNDTTSEGDYGFANVDSGKYVMIVDPDGNSYKTKRVRISLSADRSMNVTVSKLSTISGYVNDTSTGNGISDVLVYAYNFTNQSVTSDRTDSEGYYSLDIVNVSHTVELWPSGELGYKFNSTSFSSSDVGGQKNFTLESGSFLDGKVKDPGKRNLSGYINIWNESKGISRYQPFDDGEYNVTGLDETVGYNVFVSTDNSSYTDNITTVGSSMVPGTLDFNFSTLKGPKVWVTVKSSTGGTVSNATVTLEGKQKLTNSVGVAKYEEQVDSKAVEIKATKQDYNSSITTVKPQTNYTGSAGPATREIQNVTLYLKNIRGNLKDVSVNVTDDTNSTNISGATVVARSNATGRSAAAITDNDGSGTLEQILPGKNYVTAISSDSKFEVFNVTFTKGSTGNVTGSSFTMEWRVP